MRAALMSVARSTAAGQRRMSICVSSAWAAAVVPLRARRTVSTAPLMSVTSICSDSTTIVWPMAKSAPASTVMDVAVSVTAPSVSEPESSWWPR